MPTSINITLRLYTIGFFANEQTGCLIRYKIHLKPSYYSNLGNDDFVRSARIK